MVKMNQYITIDYGYLASSTSSILSLHINDWTRAYTMLGFISVDTNMNSANLLSFNLVFARGLRRSEK